MLTSHLKRVRDAPESYALLRESRREQPSKIKRQEVFDNLIKFARKEESFMQPHMEHVVEEKRELDEKREKLTSFIAGEVFGTLNGAEQSRLTRQLAVMTDYSEILRERIEASQ